MRRRHYMTRSVGLERGGPVNRRGPKTREWERERRSLKCEFNARGITRCELGLPGCMGDDGLGFAHRRKRRNITTIAELRMVCLLCNFCHLIIELQGEAKMFRVIDRIIRQRDGRIDEADAY